MSTLINKVLRAILTMMALLAPVILCIFLGMILPMSFSELFSEANILDFALHVSIQDISFHFSPAQYVMSLEWMQKIIQASGYPTIMRFIVPLIVYLIILTIATALIYTLFLTFFGSIAVFLIFLRSLPFLLFHLFIQILKSIWSMVFGNNPLRAFWIWISTYIDFLAYYGARGDSLRILKTHIEFLSYLLPFIKLPLQGEPYHVFKTKYEDRNLVINFNIVLRRIFSSQEKQYPYTANLSRNKGELGFTLMRGDSGKTLSELKRVSENEKDFTIEIGDGIFKMMPPEETKEGLQVKIVTRYYWKTQALSPIEFENLLSTKRHGDIPMGFFPKVSQGIMEYATYYISIKDFGHIFLASQSTNGKDCLSRSIILSTLIRSPYRKGYILDPKDDKFEIVFIDTKFSDASYLSGVPGCKRVLNDDDQVPLALENAVNELQRRLESFGLLGNISQWNKKHAYEEKYSHQYIFINEINDLLSTLPKGKENGDIYGRTVRAMRTLLNRGLAGGFHIVLLGQSLRKEGSELGSLLTNTGRIIGAMGNEDEARVALKSHYKDYGSLEKYNFVYIQEGGEAKQVFRPYLTDQEEISEWIDKNFNRIPEEEIIAMNDQNNISDGNTEDDFMTRSQKDKTKDFSYLQEVNIRELMTEAYTIGAFPRKLGREYGIPEKAFPFFMSRLSEENIVKIREGMTAEIQDTISLEDAIQKIQALFNG